MIKTSGVCCALSLLASLTSAFAEDATAPLPYDGPKTGFFIGVGGSYNSANYKQELDASGISNIFSGPTLVAFGEAGGPSSPFHDTQSTFAPEIQLGTFHEMVPGGWLWGAKAKYKYLDVNATDRVIDSPQSGSFTNTGAAPAATSFTGNVVIQSSQAEIEHEFSLLAQVGHSFGRGTIYAGAGPVLFGTQSNIYGATGFAAINGSHFDITGTPDNFSSSEWVWGGAMQIGMTYYIDSSWFLDFNYTYSISSEYSHNYTAPFASESAGYTDTGTLAITTSQRVNAQAFAISINRAF